MPTARPSASVQIDAPLDLVWAVMLDTGAYGEWNPFVERVVTASPAAVGNPIVLHVRWANGRTNRSTERITAVDAPSTTGATTTATLSYAFEGWPARLGLVRSVRHQRLFQPSGGPTTYDTVGEFSGALVSFAGPARIQDGFARHAAALKERAESVSRRQSG